MNQQISLDCPVNIVHGIKDEAVPWDLSIELSKKISSNSITQSFIKDGDHGLSRPTDLEYIFFNSRLSGKYNYFSLSILLLHLDFFLLIMKFL